MAVINWLCDYVGVSELYVMLSFKEDVAIENQKIS